MAASIVASIARIGFLDIVEVFCTFAVCVRIFVCVGLALYADIPQWTVHAARIDTDSTVRVVDASAASIVAVCTGGSVGVLVPPTGRDTGHAILAGRTVLGEAVGNCGCRNYAVVYAEIVNEPSEEGGIRCSFVACAQPSNRLTRRCCSDVQDRPEDASLVDCFHLVYVNLNRCFKLNVWLFLLGVAFLTVRELQLEWDPGVQGKRCRGLKLAARQSWESDSHRIRSHRNAEFARGVV
jgi:hypothetical protein